MTDTPHNSAPTLYFTYTYNCGGLADMIKGAATCWYIAQHYGFHFDHRFAHELGLIYPQKFLKLKLEKINLIDTSTSSQLRSFFTDSNNLKKSYLVYINGCLDFPKSPLVPTKPFIQAVKPFLQTVYQSFLPIQPYSKLPSQPFQVVHCRMGDIYLQESTNRRDNRIGNRQNFEDRLYYLVQNLPKNLPTLVCADSSYVQNEIASKIPGSFTIQTNQYHFAYNTKKKSNQEIMESIRTTIQEHEAISRAESIYIFSYSGFPIIAAAIGNKPIFEITPKGFIPFNSEWI